MPGKSIPGDMPHKFDPTKKELLLSSQRRRDLDPQRVISLLPIMPYHIVADIGCGPGYFTVPLGKHVYDGRIYALDIQQEMLDAVRNETSIVHLTNVDLILNEESKLPLENDSLDGVLAAFVAHEFDDPDVMLVEALRCLHKGGWIALLEWYKRDMEEGPPQEDRIDQPELRGLAQKIGFRYTSVHHLNPNQYMILMQK